MKKLLLLIRGYWRCKINGFCPNCNSNYPKIISCNICLGARELPLKGRHRDIVWRIYENQMLM